MQPVRALFVCAVYLSLAVAVRGAGAGPFVAFESGQVRPIAMSPAGDRLFVVNTPDNRLEIFATGAGDPVHLASVPVGMEPVAVAARNDNEVWVANYLSDSVSIVDVGAVPPRVVRTLLVGDEPGDIVFAGPDGKRAFITTAHRGQNSPYTDPANPGELTTPGIGRADVWVFDATSLGAAMGGTPLAGTPITLFGDTPRALSVSPDGTKVYAAVFKSGNRTTTLHADIVCDGGSAASACTPAPGEQTAPGGLPPPTNQTIDGIAQPETGLIVKFDGSVWKDELGRDWSNMVRFNLPDKDVFAIDAMATPPVETASFSGVGTVLFNMAVNPVSGKLYVANTEAVNEVRFEGERPAPPATGHDITSVRGHLAEARITVIDPATAGVTPRHLNKHIDYSLVPSPAGVSDDSLAIPKGMAVTADGSTLYLVAKGSGKVGVFDTAELESDAFVPDAADHIVLSAGGPGGLLLDEAGNRLYVTTRFDNGLSVIDTATRTEIGHLPLHNPEPATVVAGRPFLYDANLSSSNGEASCASCHIEGDKDELAWDLGNPLGSGLNNPNPFTVGPNGDPDFHPMKGPMATQTLRGMATHGPMHWRGDRTGGNDAGGSSLDEDAAFKKFNPAFVGLLGRDVELNAAEMQLFTNFILEVTPPPNPIRDLDNSLNADQQAGSDFYHNVISDIVQTCNGCHTLAPALGFFGTNGNSSFEAEPQHMKIPQLRNMYEKVGMFGMPDVAFFNSGNNGHQGDQVRGFGFLHDGSVDTLFRFHDAALFQFPNDTLRAQMEQFMFAFDSNLKPVVGQQVTLTDTNAAIVAARIDLLVGQAQAGNADLVVKGIFNGEARGWHYIGAGLFASDRVAEAALDDSALRDLAQVPGQLLTYTAAPPGSGVRMGVDRDQDGVLDGDDNCPALDDPDQTDSDGDGAGNPCDTDDDNDGLSDSFEAVLGTNTLLSDSDSDGLSDGEEVGFDGNINEYLPGQDTNPLLPDTDGDGLNDGADPLPLAANVGDGDLAPWNAPDGQVNGADLLIAQQLALGQRTPDTLQFIHGDMNFDGNIDSADLLLILGAVLQ